MVAALFAAADAAVGPQPLQHELRRRDQERVRGAVAGAQAVQALEKPRHLFDLRELFARGDVGRELQLSAVLEPLDGLVQVHAAKVTFENASDGAADQFAGYGVCAAEFALVFEFDFSGDGRHGGVEIGHAGHRGALVQTHGALLGVAGHAFGHGNGQALADAGTFVHALVFARQESDLLDDLAEVLGNFEGNLPAPLGPGLLLRDAQAFLDGGGIVRADLRADAVLERGDDFAAGGVVLRVCGEDDEDVEGQAQRVAFDLYVALLHDVEQSHLNFSRQVGQLVDGEDAAVGAREQAVMHGQLVGKVAAAAGGADGIHVADDVGHGDVGRGQFFNVALGPRQPPDGRGVALIRHAPSAGLADGAVGIVVDFAARDDGKILVQEGHQAAEDAAFGLAAKAQQDEVLPRQEGVDDLRDDGVLVAVHASKQRFARGQHAQQVFARLLAHATVAD